MGGISISRQVLADKDTITSSVIAGWSNSTASYSGDWNTCASVRNRVKFADKFKKNLSKKDQKRLEDMIDKYTNKWESSVIDLGVVGYDVIKVKKVAKKATAKYKKMYVVYAGNGLIEDCKKIKACSTKTEAKKAAEEYAIKNGATTFISEEQVKLSGSTLAETYTVTRTRKTRKPSKGNYKEVHAYYVTAIASC